MPTTDLQWRWVKFDEELETGLEFATAPDGWLAWTGPEGDHAALVYESHFGKRAAVQMGSLDLEIDVHGSWEQGKARAELLLRHANAINAELSG